MVVETKLYDALGVPVNADSKAIRLAYRRLALKYHPDKSTEADAASKFTEISYAYEILSDEEKRRVYDTLGTRGLDPSYQAQAYSMERARAMFWTFMQGPGWRQDNQAPSRANALATATLGTASAPFKALGVGGAVAGVGLIGGAVQAGAGVVSGVRGFGEGVSEYYSGQANEESRGKVLGLAVRPVAGLLTGAATAVGGLVGGAGVSVAGTIGGVAMNVRHGADEWRDASSNGKRLTTSPAAAASESTALVTRTPSEGRDLFLKAMSGGT